jgi:hypothetical protein
LHDKSRLHGNAAGGTRIAQRVKLQWQVRAVSNLGRNGMLARVKADLSPDDLLAMKLLARDAITAGEQAAEARGLGAHGDAVALETERRQAIAQIYEILGVRRPLSAVQKLSVR